MARRLFGMIDIVDNAALVFGALEDRRGGEFGYR